MKRFGALGTSGKGRFKLKREKKKTGVGKKLRHWGRGLSLKKALLFTTVSCVLLGLLANMLLVLVSTDIHNDLYHTYIEPVYEEHADELSVRLYDNDGSYITTVYHDFFGADEAALIPFGIQSVTYKVTDGGPLLLLCVIVSLLFVFLNAWWFYRWKLKPPLQVLSAASEQIARNDLDFQIEAQSKDELGALCASFETMRVSLKENNEAMWRTVEERRRLNAALAHDLRTPITVLLGYGDYLQKGLANGSVPLEKAKETVATMTRNIRRLQRYTEDMKDLQALEDLQPAKERLSFAELQQQTDEIGQALLQEKFHAEYLGSGQLLLDKTLFFRVCENLLSNAGRYAEKRVVLGLTLQEGLLSLSVTDDGPGFSPEGLRRAAEPYYREGGPAEGETHYGLGLYISRVLCEKHGGSLTIWNSEQGGGQIQASFSVGGCE